eukprot:s4263_g8.t1
MAASGPGILVEGNSEEESAVLREEILHKAGLLTKFGLQEEIAEQPTQRGLRSSNPAGSDQEDDDFFIVVKSEFMKLEDPEVPLSDETLSRLLDVPEEAAVRANSELAKELLAVNSTQFPNLCLQIKSFLDIGSEEEHVPDVPASDHEREAICVSDKQTQRSSCNGCSDVGDHPRVLALIPEDDFSILLEKFPAMVAGSLVLQDPTPRQAGQGALVGRTCRVVVGLKFAPIGAAPPPLSSEQLTMLHALFQSGRLHPG